MNDKPRMIEITDPVTLKEFQDGQGNLNIPVLINGRFVDAEEFTAWRTAFIVGSSNTSSEKQP
jgi:hypothetical protein